MHKDYDVLSSHERSGLPNGLLTPYDAIISMMACAWYMTSAKPMLIYHQTGLFTAPENIKLVINK